MKKIKPYAISMIFADHIHVDNGTGKLYIIGMFHSIYSKVFPVKHPIIAIYQQFAELNLDPERGTGTIEIRYLDGEHEKICEINGNFKPGRINPLVRGTFLFFIKDLVIPRPGPLEFSFYLDGEFINQGNITVLEKGD